ncbi:HECT-domain-containing protein [Dendrothele bispora CBS 962.96]|uniref:HECT-type E3 ubiquitin transferase n=1 Tax=Dendrothele bispora (strain CBS 962.96) TaxID=1314807 RepID=A0A4S8MLN8_DENBC|nr:HECT-domain-containing protein [Dendrothele bispora CBS 962.96]
MLPVWGNERKRTINLGGAATSTSQSTILDQAKVRREERLENKRKADAAIKIQSWWRGAVDARRVRAQVRAELEKELNGSEREPPVGIQTMRRLVIVGKSWNGNEETSSEGKDVLGLWSEKVLLKGTDSLFYARENPSWLTLIKQISLLVVRAIADDPLSSSTPAHLKVITGLLSTSTQVPWSFTASITSYLFDHRFYCILGQAIRRIPVEAKTNFALPLLMPLVLVPLTTFTSTSPLPASHRGDYQRSFHHFVTQILTVPLLPNRLSLQTLTQFSAGLPVTELDTLFMTLPPRTSNNATIMSTSPPDVVDPLSLPNLLSDFSTVGIENKLHLIANLLAFMPPRYPKLSASALTAYIRLLSSIVDGIPVGGMEDASNSSNLPGNGTTPVYADSEDEDGPIAHVSVVSSFASPTKIILPVLDSRTYKRLATLGSPGHLVSLLTAVSKALTRTEQRYWVVRFLFALVSVHSSGTSLVAPSSKMTAGKEMSAGDVGRKQRQDILGTVWTWNGGGLVREIWRGWTRGGGLGRDIAKDAHEKGRNFDPTSMDVDSSDSFGSRRSHFDPLIPNPVRSQSRLLALGGQGSQGGGDEDPWAPLLLLADLYSQALLTMGDDEFFSSGSSLNSISTPSTPTSLKNPLGTDEIAMFSRQLLNIAWVLYMHGPELGISSEGVSLSAGMVLKPATRVGWLEIRDKVTRCLLAIHDRDARKPFTPKGHWLVLPDVDDPSEDAASRNYQGRGRAQIHLSVEMVGFVEAAVTEAQQLAEAADVEEDGEDMRFTLSHSHRGRMNHRTMTSSAVTRRQQTYLSPRLAILNNVPFAIPFHVRVAIFRSFVNQDRARHRERMNAVHNSNTRSRRVGSMAMMEEFGMGLGGNGRQRIAVRRGMIAQDGFDKLGEMDLKNPVEITFIDQWGEEEAGIDGGGVFKEFFTSLCKEVFDTDRGLWLMNKKNELYPNPHGYATESHSLNWYRFIGRILGKAMYEGILVDVAFAGFFLAKWLGKQSFLDDLASLDPDLYNGLIFLKHYAGDPEDLSLNFTVAVEEFGTARSVDLIRNGSNITVTKENRLQYIYLVSHFKLSKQIKQQSEAFFEGLSEMIDPKWLRMFDQQEVQILIGGVNTPIDLDDLRANTMYGGLYDNNEDTITAFWNVVNTFDQEQRRGLLRFVTSCSRPPLLGFKELIPNFSIRDAGSDQHRLPTASTCVNLLKLPRYKDERVLRAKLLQAINANAGFDLS